MFNDIIVSIILSIATEEKHAKWIWTEIAECFCTYQPRDQSFARRRVDHSKPLYSNHQIAEWKKSVQNFKLIRRHSFNFPKQNFWIFHKFQNKITFSFIIASITMASANLPSSSSSDSSDSRNSGVASAISPSSSSSDWWNANTVEAIISTEPRISYELLPGRLRGIYYSSFIDSDPNMNAYMHERGVLKIDPDAICSVCLEDCLDDTEKKLFKTDNVILPRPPETIRHQLLITACNHSFHQACIQSSYRTKKSCPICRRLIKKYANHIYSQRDFTISYMDSFIDSGTIPTAAKPNRHESLDAHWRSLFPYWNSTEPAPKD